MSQIASDSLATPQALYRSEQVRALDRHAIERLGIAGFELMQRAARAAFRELLRRWPGVRRVIVLCGGGNNGGDGYVVAGMAQMHGLRVTCWHASPPERLQGDARRAWTWACERGVMPEALPARWPALDEGDVIVDALLGIGLQGAVRDALRGAIASVNAAGVPILALDVPSGLCADTGRVLGAAVQASATVTFIAMKPGLLTGQGVDYVGTLRCDDLGVGEGVRGVQDPCAYRIDWPSQRILLPRRRRSAHKGQFGHVLVVGGDDGMGGAVLLAAEAALRAGAGLVSVATRSSHVPALLARRPEVMARGIEHGNDLDALLARASVIVIGPGLGRS
ncbi:MAG: NAD(P)H-hydrate epimerase, partial [Gammaproteobacteria bacterium]|nr:NAD(P)H-hydrate epimerase [Gammaproteobacteria bacterium]